jgi:hypothetical protein
MDECLLESDRRPTADLGPTAGVHLWAVGGAIELLVWYGMVPLLPPVSVFCH